jgi:C-terminal processing protease CtpA/Prc
MKTKFIVPAFILLLALSCKKNNDNIPSQPTGNGTEEELLMDSVYLYSKEIYFWNDLIPSYEDFRPRQYKGSNELSSAQNVMGAIRDLQPKDRFSFVTTQEESEAIQTGEDKDFGFFVKAAALDIEEPMDSIYWFVTYVYDQSTAGAAGIERGWIVNKINGSQLNYDQASANLLNSTFFGNDANASFEFIKPDNTAATVSLNKTTFQANSVLHKEVINAGGKKVGYLVFNQFFGQHSRNELGDAFAFFQSQGINDLVVDLRYNPGGSTETQDTLADLIAPQAANGQRMYAYQFNQQLQKDNFPLLKRKRGFQNVLFTEDANSIEFEKAGSLNLTRVFFIVTGSTASASELLINNLRPYMEVKLVGDTTYGKPVGFFPIPVFNYALYPVSFRTINSAGQADYYDGFAPDKLANDGVNKNWGDASEPSLSAVLNYIVTGTFGRPAKAEMLQMDAQHSMKPMQKLLESKKFIGMYKE